VSDGSDLSSFGDPFATEQLEGLIAQYGDNPSIDPLVAAMVRDAKLICIGELQSNGTVLLLHATVPVGDVEVDVPRVFTGFGHVDTALFMKPAWVAYEIVTIPGRHVLTDLGPDETLAINPWSGCCEFKLPPGTVPAQPTEGVTVLPARSAGRMRRTPDAGGAGAPHGTVEPAYVPAPSLAGEPFEQILRNMPDIAAVAQMPDLRSGRARRFNGFAMNALARHPTAVRMLQLASGLSVDSPLSVIVSQGWCNLAPAVQWRIAVEILVPAWLAHAAPDFSDRGVWTGAGR
jgi:hypothetical protein